MRLTDPELDARLEAFVALRRPSLVDELGREPTEAELGDACLLAALDFAHWALGPTTGASLEGGASALGLLDKHGILDALTRRFPTLG